MRVLACADVHGILERAETVRALVSEHRPAVLLLAGDLADWDDPVGSLGALGTSTRTFAVPGNMDRPDTTAELARRGWLLGEEAIVVEGVAFGGPAARSPCDVVVSHYPPRGTLDEAPGAGHIGSRRVRDLLERTRPRLVVCGHVHGQPGIERVGDTVVVNCSMGAGRVRGALIEIDEAAVSARLL